MYRVLRTKLEVGDNVDFIVFDTTVTTQIGIHPHGGAHPGRPVPLRGLLSTKSPIEGLQSGE